MDQNTSIKKSVIIVGIEKSSMVIVQFISSIILARLLGPSDYGIVAMLSIFIALATTISDSGFGGSLVYFKDVTKKDYNTVFGVNLLLSLFLYTLMHLFAEPISNYYNTPILSKLIKILGLCVIFNSLGTVQFTILYKNLKFKKIAYISIITYIVSAIIAIIMAYLRYGVWALISQQVLYSIIRTSLLFFINRFIPTPFISFKLLKKHWDYGKGLFFSTILRTIYDNMYVQLIGKYSTMIEAGLYNQAKKLKDIPTNLFSQTFDYSLFPIFSKLEDEIIFDEKYRKINKIFAFVCVPIFIIIGLLSEQIVIILLGEKWSGCSFILQWLSMGSIFYIFELVNRSALKAKGLTSIIFKTDLVKRILGILLIIILIIQYRINGVIVAYCINSFTGWAINSIVLSKHSKYNFSKQLSDISRYIIISLFPSAIVIYTNSAISSNPYYSLSVSLLVFNIIYFFECFIIHDKSYIYIIKQLKKQIR